MRVMAALLEAHEGKATIQMVVLDDENVIVMIADPETIEPGDNLEIVIDFDL